MSRDILHDRAVLREVDMAADKKAKDAKATRKPQKPPKPGSGASIKSEMANRSKVTVTKK